MTATAHALVGGAIAATIKDPVLGLSIAFLSHPLLDMIPHWDAGWGWRNKTKQRLFLEASADMLLGLCVSYLLFGHGVGFIYFFGCIIAAELLDLAEIPYWFFHWDFPPFSWVYQFQHQIQGKAKLPWGIMTQVAACSIIFVLLQIFGILVNI